MVTLADGRFVHPRAVWQVFKADAEVLQYQLTQYELGRFGLTLVTVDEAAFDRALARALPELQRLLGREAVIDAVQRRDIDRTGGGKHRAVASLCSAQLTSTPR
jgi:hypothetical protein